MFAERDKHYPSRSGQTSLATAVANITKPVTKYNFGPSSITGPNEYFYMNSLEMLRFFYAEKIDSFEGHVQGIRIEQTDQGK